MQATDRPHVHGEARAKILSLLKEIDDTYKKHIRQSIGKTCDICGKGDTDEVHKVKDVASGYTHRENLSPCLCYNHWHGWTISYNKLEKDRKAQLLGINRRAGGPSERFQSIIEIERTIFEESVLLDEEIDLHFARYLANQLRKATR
jgi:hypothetical protein